MTTQKIQDLTPKTKLEKNFKKNIQFFLLDKKKILLLQSQKATDLWCNGSTYDFGSYSQGSSPCRSTKPLSNQRLFLFTI